MAVSDQEIKRWISERGLPDLGLAKDMSWFDYIHEFLEEFYSDLDWYESVKMQKHTFKTSNGFLVDVEYEVKDGREWINLAVDHRMINMFESVRNGGEVFSSDYRKRSEFVFIVLKCLVAYVEGSIDDLLGCVDSMMTDIEGYQSCEENR